MKVDTYDQVNKVVLKQFKRRKYSCQWCVDQRKGIIFSQRIDLQKFPASDGWLDKWKKRLGLIFLFQTYLLYNYSHLGRLSLRILMNFFSAIKNSRDGTFISNPSF